MIRTAEMRDAAEIHRLLKQTYEVHSELYPEYFTGERQAKYEIAEVAKLIADEGKLVIVFDEGNQLAGYVIGWYEDAYFFIDDVCVDESRRGKGVGKRLFEVLEQRVNAKSIRLNVWIRNRSAMEFYEKIGFHPLKTVLEKQISKDGF